MGIFVKLSKINVKVCRIRDIKMIITLLMSDAACVVEFSKLLQLGDEIYVKVKN
jgi:hypothetical protein